MGKITFKTGFGTNDGKTLTKPFTYNGKTYNKITLKSGFGTSDGKVLIFEKPFPHIRADMFKTFNALLGRGVTFRLQYPNWKFTNELRDAVGLVEDGAAAKKMANTFIADMTSALSITSVDAEGYAHIVTQVDNVWSTTVVSALWKPESIPIHLTAGHTYRFEQGKNPIDLGPISYDINTYNTHIKTTDYSILSAEAYDSDELLLDFTDCTLVPIKVADPNTMSPNDLWLIDIKQDIILPKTISTNDYNYTNYALRGTRPTFGEKQFYLSGLSGVPENTTLLAGHTYVVGTLNGTKYLLKDLSSVGK